MQKAPVEVIYAYQRIIFVAQVKSAALEALIHGNSAITVSLTRIYVTVMTRTPNFLNTDTKEIKLKQKYA